MTDAFTGDLVPQSREELEAKILELRQIENSPLPSHVKPPWVR
ncbi:MAG: hypothetical protein AAB874_07735 [Patescibacteria group bacterium]